MRRIVILALLLSACLMSAAWGQQQTGMPRMGKGAIARHRVLKGVPNSSAATSNTRISAPTPSVQTLRFYELGTYSNGTWAQMLDINDWGVAVGLGDTPSGYDATLDPPRGYTRPLGIPLFGRDAMQWFDLGTFGGESYAMSGVEVDTQCSGITDTGMIVGLAPTTDDPITKTEKYVRAFAWTAKSGMIDLGALENRGYHHSNSIGVNKLGTLIVGWSGATKDFSAPTTLPVAWTLSAMPQPGKPVTTWGIRQLDTKGFEQFQWWVAMTANDFSQIIGNAFDDTGAQIAVLWNPLPGGRNWKAMLLPLPSAHPDYIYPWSVGINEKGEIVGYIYSAHYSSVLAALWQPVDPHRQRYSITVLSTPAGLPENSSSAASINDLGDIVGTSYDVDGNSLPTYWSTKDPSSAQLLDFNGHFGLANKVNNFRMVVGGYWSDTCPQGCAAAVQLR